MRPVFMDNEQKSRTQKKKEDRALQKVGESFVSLTPAELEKINLPNEFIEAVKMAQKIKSHQAKRRQMQRIGTIIREIDEADLQNVLQEIKQKGDRKAHILKKVETWCFEIKQGDDTRIDEIVTTYPEVERRRLSQLARNARKASEPNKEEKALRTMVRYISQILLR